MSLSRLVTLVAAIAVLALAFSCGTPGQPDAQSHTRGDRPSKRPPPIVPVVVENGMAVPHPVEVPVNARAGHGPDSQPIPSVVIWFGPKDKNLLIEMKHPKDQVCFRKDGAKKDGVFCDGNRCFAATNVDFRGANPVPCDYRVWIEGVTQPYDPVVIVDNCCDQ